MKPYFNDDFSKILVELQGGSFDWRLFVAKEQDKLPAEYLSDPKGNRQVSESFDGKGGCKGNEEQHLCSGGDGAACVQVR